MLPLFRRRVSKDQDTIKSQQKIQDTLPLFRRRVSIKSRYPTTLPQKSQQKIKIRFHSSAEESAKSQDTLPLFCRRVSLSVRGLTHIPPKNIYFMGLTHIPPILFHTGGVDAYSPTSNLHGVDAISPKLSNHVI